MSWFRNVDLDVYSSRPLVSLIAAFGNSIDVLFVGQEGEHYAAHLELSGSGYGQSPDEIISALATLVEHLPESARRDWDEALIRRFDIGVEAQSTPHAFQLQSSTIAAVAKINASVAVTVYPDER